jgi:hypothetical protein
MFYRACLSTFMLAVLFHGHSSIAATSPATAPTAVPMPPSTAYRLTLQRFMNGQNDLVVTAFVREGRPCYAFAQSLGIDQALHRVDLSPAAPIEYIVEGQRFTPPEKLKSNYDYKNTEFLKYRGMYDQGKITMRNYDAPPPLSFAGDRTNGVFDLFLDRPDHRNRDVFRVQVDLKAREGGAAAGTYSAFNYDPKDEKFAPVGEKIAGLAALDVTKDFAAHTTDRAYAKGTDWPQQHGPTLTGSAVDCQRNWSTTWRMPGLWEAWAKRVEANDAVK